MIDDSQKIEELRSYMILCTAALLEALALHLEYRQKLVASGAGAERIRQLAKELPSP